MTADPKAGAAQETLEEMAWRIWADVPGGRGIDPRPYILDFAQRLRAELNSSQAEEIARLRDSVREQAAFRQSDAARHECQTAALETEIARLREWKEAMLGAVKAIPEYEIGEWGGDKEGWGYCFEVVHHVRREIARLRDASEHWNDLYRKECLLRQDDAARYGQQIIALEEQIATAARQKPVAWMMRWQGHRPSLTLDKSDYLPNEQNHLIPLYAAPVPAGDAVSVQACEAVRALRGSTREPSPFRWCNECLVLLEDTELCRLGRTK